MTQHIVLFGTDQSLDWTRSLLLSKMGYSVSHIESIPELIEICQRSDPDLVIVCYTVPTDHCHQLILAARQLANPPRIALLSSRVDGNRWGDIPGEVVLIENPKQFLASIHHLLGTSPA